MSVMRDIVSRVLSAEGAAVAPVEPDGLEVIATSALQRALDIDELTCLGFGAQLPEGAKRVTLESEWMNQLESLEQGRGRFLRLVSPPDRARSVSTDAADLLRKAVSFENATFRYRSDAPAWTSYLLLTFRITAVSDEKREELTTLCVNESNGAYADPVQEPLIDGLRAGPLLNGTPPEDLGAHASWTGQRVRDWCMRVLPARVAGRLKPFLAGMERRMSTDLERLHSYHSRLRDEAASKIVQTGEKQADQKLVRREELRIQSIEREYHAKIADLRRKYAMNVEVQLTQALRLITPVHRISFSILRRKGVRNYHLDWNGLARHLDRLPCEGCGLTAASHAICDDRLHILCHNCLAPCPSCTRPYCHACHPTACPRCPAGEGKKAE